MEADWADGALFAAGAVAVALAAVPYRAFDLDRFFAPKELALHVFALALALRALRRAKILELAPADLLLLLYLVLGALSAVHAPDRWLAGRALAVTLSGAGVFWAARAGGEATRRTVVAAAAAAAVVAAATSLAQAYGAHPALFSPHRVPGGTLGNRNFVAHLAAVFAPALVLAVLRARRSWAAWAGVLGAGVLAAALVLTRSRAALLGLSAGGAMLAFGLRRLRGGLDEASTRRLKRLAAAAALGALAALALPNKLRWKSRSPYLDTVAKLADYQHGSGRGRMLQYTRSLRIAAAHPLLGAGPGNWSLVYPRYVKDFDRSIDYTTGRTINPWPSSDWVAVLAERGLPALGALAGLFALLFLTAWTSAAGGAQALEGCALAAVLAAAAVVGCFDAFQLLPAPAFLLWGLAGALAAASPVLLTVTLSPLAARRLSLAAVVVWGAAMLRSGGQLAGMSIYARARTRAQVARAALFDPGSARIRARLEALRHPAPAAPPVAAEPFDEEGPEQSEAEADAGFQRPPTAAPPTISAPAAAAAGDSRPSPEAASSSVEKSGVR